MLRQSPWPGNVRQLRHVLESSLVLADGDVLDVADLTLPEMAARPGPPSADREGTGFKEQVADFELRLLREALDR